MTVNALIAVKAIKKANSVAIFLLNLIVKIPPSKKFLFAGVYYVIIAQSVGSACADVQRPAFFLFYINHFRPSPRARQWEMRKCNFFVMVLQYWGQINYESRITSYEDCVEDCVVMRNAQCVIQ